MRVRCARTQEKQRIQHAPIPEPTSTSLKKCIPTTTRKYHVRSQYEQQRHRLRVNDPRDSATAKAVVECPDGNENRSRVTMRAQQCGSISRGRIRPTTRLIL